MPTIEQQPSGLEKSKVTFKGFEEWTKANIDKAKAKFNEFKESLFSSERAGITERWKDISNNPEAKETLVALARLGINIGFTVADMIPGAGEVTETGLNALKMAGTIYAPLRDLDPTKSLSATETIAVQALTSPVELASLGTAPTYLINTIRQTWADYKAGNFSKAKEVVGYLITGNRDYYDKLKENSSKLDAAAGVLKK